MPDTTRKAVLAALVTLGVSAPVLAETQWERDHPRRDQVNDRLENQNKRIKEERKEGEITKAQAKNLHQQDKQIRTEERAMARQQGGHITKAQQKALNQQENQMSKEIGK